MSEQPLKLLTIGGSDSGGAVGVQADLKTWTAVGVHGMSALTVITAQNSTGIAAVHFLPADFVERQITAVLSDYGADGIKTGFIGRTDLIEVIAANLQNRPNVVIDPVLLSSQGHPLFDDNVVTAYRQLLMPQATIITPNIGEAALLTGRPITTLASADVAARTLGDDAGCAVVLKRLRHADQMIDILYDGSTTTHLPTPYIDTDNTHGSGDALSAMIAVGLAKQQPLATTVATAQQFVARGLAAARNWRLGAGQGPIAHY